MDLYSQKSRSYPQKIVILVLATVSVVVSYGALLSNRFAGVRVAGLNISVSRSLILFSFNIIVYGRVLFTLFYFLERRIPVGEVLAIPLAFAVYLVGFPLLAASNRHGAGLLEIAGIVLFVLGSLLNSFAELQRKRWKLRPENKGRLYTGGLFSWSMHINYFGDLVWVTGYALVTHNPWSAAIPVCLFGFFYFWNIPRLDAHLSQKYGQEFTAYASRTKRLIPLIL